MRSNRKILFGLLLILGAFGFYRLFKYVSSAGSAAGQVATNTTASGNPNLQPVSAKVPTGRVAQARIDIPANTIVTPEMLRMAPHEGQTQGFITDIESQGAGYITRVDIPAGSEIRPQYDFVGHVSETGIAGLLRPGTRAMVVPLANKPTLHDLVRIGNYVDILAAFDGQESRTIVQNVRVLGVDLSANDYPNVNVAMRGPSKADAKAGAAKPAGTPGATPTPAPNAPRPDPAITLEVTPQQAAALQLAIASSATLDYLVRPAIPGNRSTEVAPVEGANGQPTIQNVSVVKPQIAPYSSRLKAAGGSGAVKGGSGNGGGSESSAPTIRRGGPRPEFIGNGPESFPNPGQPTTISPAIPTGNPNTGTNVNTSVPSFTPAPTPTQMYTIPVFGDGKILRTETVPLPNPAT